MSKYLIRNQGLYLLVYAIKMLNKFVTRTEHVAVDKDVRMRFFWLQEKRGSDSF